MLNFLIVVVFILGFILIFVKKILYAYFFFFLEIPVGNYCKQTYIFLVYHTFLKCSFFQQKGILL